MKVLNLRCTRLHCFEGWFGSEADFQNQLGRGMVTCPFCADSAIQKMPSAPRLNLGGPAASHPGQSSARDLAGPSSKDPASKDGSNPAAESGPLSSSGAAEHPAFLAALRQVMARTENVGRQFADEARRMHYGETPTRNIRGQASLGEALELREEGIEVVALPLFPGSEETLQ